MKAQSTYSRGEINEAALQATIEQLNRYRPIAADKVRGMIVAWLSTPGEPQGETAQDAVWMYIAMLREHNSAT